MEYILKNVLFYDPANKINGEKKDVMFKDGIIVDEVSSDAKVIDVTDKIVMQLVLTLTLTLQVPKLVVGKVIQT